jgi:hypothetical protein
MLPSHGKELKVTRLMLLWNIIQTFNKGNPANFNSIHEPIRHAKRNKPDTEGQLLHGTTYMTILK